MPRTYKRTTDYGLISHDAMMEAVELVMGVMSVRKVAQEKGLSKSSLSRYVQKHKENPTAVLAPNYSHCQTFTTEQETQLEDYLIQNSTAKTNMAPAASNRLRMKFVCNLFLGIGYAIHK